MPQQICTPSENFFKRYITLVVFKKQIELLLWCNLKKKIHCSVSAIVLVVLFFENNYSGGTII